MKKKPRVLKKKTTKSLKRDLKSIVNEFDLNPGSILIKPNFNTADDFPASTDKLFLTELVSILEERKEIDKIYIGDSSTFYKNSEKVIKRKKLADLSSKDKVRVVNFDKLERVIKEIPDGKYLKKASIPKLINQVDNLIYLPCMKTHFHADYTGSIKLSVGLMPTGEKMRFHLGNLQKKIAELNKLVTPDIIIMDGRKCFISGGPVSGTLKEPGIILASDDRVAIDLEAVNTIKSYAQNSLSDKKPLEIMQIKKMIEFGLGSPDYKLIDF